MYDTNPKQQTEDSNTMPSTDHAAEGKKYLKEGLELVRKGDIDNAVEAFVKAAIAFERSQDFRLISALWEAAGDLLEPSFKEKNIEWLNQLQNDSVSSVHDKGYHWPLNYHTILWNVWKKQSCSIHRQAWAYQWAAEHLERSARYRTASRLFLKAAEKTELTEDGKTYPDWPAGLFCRSIQNYIRFYGTAGENIRAFGLYGERNIKKIVEKMEVNCLRIKDKAKAYKFLAAYYRTLKSSLIDAGNLTEAEQFKRKERSALMHYYFYKGNYFRAIAEWLAGNGFKYFIVGLFLMVFVIFPWIYYQWNLVASTQGNITYLDATLYSIEVALGIRHDEFYAVGHGRLLNIIEAALSWLGLGVFIWWLTRRLE